MVLKPQLQELLSKQFLKRPWESFAKTSDLLLAVAWATPHSLFLTDGILVVQTRLDLDLTSKFRSEPGFEVNVNDLEGFVCLFENCRIEIANGDLFERPKEGDLSKLFRKKDFRSEAKRGDCDESGKSKLHNLEQGEVDHKKVKFEVVNRTVIDLEDSSLANSSSKLKKRISKNKKSRKKLNGKQKKVEEEKLKKKLFENNQNLKKEDYKAHPVINFYLDFKQFSIISPYGKYFLSGKREMMVDSLSYEKIQFFERKFKLEKHIKKMNDPTNDTFVPVLELGDLIEEINCEKVEEKKKDCSSNEVNTRTSTPSGNSKDFMESHKVPSNFQFKKRRKAKNAKL